MWIWQSNRPTFCSMFKLVSNRPTFCSMFKLVSNRPTFCSMFKLLSVYLADTRTPLESFVGVLRHKQQFRLNMRRPTVWLSWEWTDLSLLPCRRVSGFLNTYCRWSWLCPCSVGRGSPPSETWGWGAYLYLRLMIVCMVGGSTDRVEMCCTFYHLSVIAMAVVDLCSLANNHTMTINNIWPKHCS